MGRKLTWALAALIAGACGNGAGPAPTEETSAGDGPVLSIQGRAFGSVPQLAPGESMVIVNLDSVRHTFTSADDSWEAVELAGDSEAPFTVPGDLAPGRYIFFCEVHSDMGGSLTVAG